MSNARFSLDLAVRKLLRKKRMSQTALAGVMGVKYGTLNTTIRRNKPSLCTCEAIAEALEVTLVELISNGYITHFE